MGDFNVVAESEETSGAYFLSGGFVDPARFNIFRIGIVTSFRDTTGGMRGPAVQDISIVDILKGAEGWRLVDQLFVPFTDCTSVDKRQACCKGKSSCFKEMHDWMNGFVLK